MKRFTFLVVLAGTFIVLANPAISAAKDKPADTAVMDSGAIVSLDPGEEAKKIRNLVKLALASNSTAQSHQVLSQEIALVEKNKKLKDRVVARLLQDDDPDPTLPAVELVHYPDGKVRGLLFTQRDNVHGTPNKLAWALDNKLEQKEQAR